MLVSSGYLQRKCGCGNHTVTGGECAECQKKQLRGKPLQTKLAINEPGDAYEQEADRVADQVLAAPAQSGVSGTPLHIQRFTGQATGDAGTGPASVDRVFASSGRLLEPALQHDMGQRFGHDFSRVRVHDKPATSLAATRSTTLSRDGDVETRTQALSPSPIISTPRTSVDHCAITAATFTSIPSGTVAATLIGGRLQAPFVMRATFQNAIPCTCSNGEYRQYVRGSFTAGGSPVIHMLGPGRPLSATTFQEDGDVAAGTVYGHRSVLGTKSRFLPDQAGGCEFRGEDEPGISAASGTVVAMDLEFQGDLIDTSDSNRVVTTSSWSASGSATMP